MAGERTKPSARKIMSGTHSMLWIDGEKCYEMTSFESNLETNREEIQFAGDMVPDSKLMSASGTWSATIRKIYSRTKKVVENVLNGIDIRSTIIAKINDPDNGGIERVQYDNCWFDSATIQKIEQGAICEDEISGGFTGITFLDHIEDPCK